MRRLVFCKDVLMAAGFFWAGHATANGYLAFALIFAALGVAAWAGTLIFPNR